MAKLGWMTGFENSNIDQYIYNINLINMLKIY